MSLARGALRALPAIAGEPPVLPELFTLAEAAARLRMGQSTLRGLARRGEIGHARSGKRLIFTPGDLIEYIARRRVAPAEAAQ